MRGLASVKMSRQRPSDQYPAGLSLVSGIKRIMVFDCSYREFTFKGDRCVALYGWSVLRLKKRPQSTRLMVSMSSPCSLRIAILILIPLRLLEPVHHVCKHVGRTGLLRLGTVAADPQIMCGIWPLAWDELLRGRLWAIPTGCPILLRQLRKASRGAGRNKFAWVRKTMWAVPVLYQPG